MLVSLHILCAFLSLALLIIRGAMQLMGKNWRYVKLLKFLPHSIDTLLITTGLTIFFAFDYQLENWLIIKFVMLMLYIFFSAKYFSRNVSAPKTIFLILAISSFLIAMLFAYIPNI